MVLRGVCVCECACAHAHMRVLQIRIVSCCGRGMGMKCRRAREGIEHGRVSGMHASRKGSSLLTHPPSSSLL